LPLQSKPDADNKYSSSDDRIENNLEINDDDLIDLEAELQAGIDACPEIETVESMLASLDDFDPDDAVPVAPVPDWLIEVRELARKHGPFTPAQIAQTVHELSAPADGPVR
jgi:hypothetical protein